MTTLNESSLSRVWQHFTDPNSQAAILTAFRGPNECTYEQNLERNKILTSYLRKYGYGYIFVEGHWVENQGTEDEIQVKESSVLVNAGKNKQDFVKNIHALGNKFNQDAVLVKDPNGTRLIFKDGSTQDIGTLQPGKMGTMYSRLRNNKATNTFVFESESEDEYRGWMARMIELAGIKNSQ